MEGKSPEQPPTGAESYIDISLETPQGSSVHISAGSGVLREESKAGPETEGIQGLSHQHHVHKCLVQGGCEVPKAVDALPVAQRL